VNNILKIFLISLLSVLRFSTLLAQEIKTNTLKTDSLGIKDILLKAFFLEDSVQIGQRVHLIVKCSYPSGLDLVMSDSTYSYKPLTFVKKDFFPTVRKGNMNIDSVVYTFSSFEIEPVQYLQVPVFVVNERDSSIIWSNRDSLYFKSLVPEKSSTTQLKDQSNVVLGTDYFDYPFIILLGLILLLLISLVWFFLGSRILKAYRLYQFSNRQSKFIKDFSRITSRITLRKSFKDIERALVIWKNHLEYIEKIPFSTFTSKEIIQIIPDEDLSESLKNIDKTIYGRELSNEIESSLLILAKFAVNLFETKQKEIQSTR